MSRQLLVGYIPVLHEGYLKFFRKYAGSVLYILGSDFLHSFEHLQRDIRAISAQDMAAAISALYIFRSVYVLNRSFLPSCVGSPLRIVMPDEDVSRAIAKKYFVGRDILFESIFLRWDMKNTTSEKEISPDRVISQKAFDVEMMGHAFAEAEKSPDWWRQVGALAVKDGKILLSAFNKHMPHQQSLYVFGDPRSNFSWGKGVEFSTPVHAEQGVIAEAAKHGISTDGASLYVTTFPCPRCAGEVVRAGFARVYYSEGYSLTGAEEVFRGHNIEIVRVDRKNPIT
ncbi:MAG: hypothetical protein HYT93_02775 [Parcubacteria group bacterium]|nr:hypothetical protein [Parcubacteria group bacterium]